mmetsp:Transcript_13156/g.18202  ORF Transcript_13156/g.18202 Transcript_13156/m.18202 type:complete len:738 (+) Transcript_13156:91-2304(+)|eukprot:CAMPEP_0184491444 /NCGR_PEP_ID=MMETSP0113_2-20130426/20403_1 /TAXON_ID=91329 /ORGANISM="Norrisiella sphaerica, Strain BC52" /LENGTH=737 /DNA_ID=CAMNT_0026875813 /DNA_START=32 /DNA_END=2245 /DNA_ORIENTATION=+
MPRSFNRNRKSRKVEQDPPPVAETAVEDEVEQNETKAVELSPEELAREYETTYEAKDPNVPPNIAYYHYKEREYQLHKPKNVSAQVHMCVHFKMTGNLILKDGEEAKEQNIKDPVEEEKVVKVSAATQSQFDDIEAKFAAIDANMAFAESETKAEDLEEAGKEEKKKEEEEGEEKKEEEKKEKEDIYAKNQFNFSDRASQTVSQPSRSKEVATKMPPAVKFSRSVFQWTIYDKYVEQARANVAARLAAEKKGSRDKKKKKEQTVLTYSGSAESVARNKILNHPRAKLLAQMLDRIVVQNNKSLSLMKFKYTTENDEKDHRGENKATGRGSFEHLFTCQYSEAKNKTVTAVCWNKKYMDMFAVGYGSYDFMPKNQKGMICIYSLKNAAYPLYVFRTHSGVMSIDFHPLYPNLLACGMYDGTVSVYDVTVESGKPLFIADDPQKKHWEPVWNVRWKKTVPGKPNAFTSISSDGRIKDWVMAKTELLPIEVMQLKAKEKLEGEEDDGEDGEQNQTLAGGQCFDVTDAGDLYVVGTDEGELRTYAKEYDTECLEKFQGHHSQVYACRWNKFNTNVFISSSHDWNVKIWHKNCFEPIMSFDLASPVGDVQWAPYSSTVFACVTDDNWLRLYDVNVDKHEPIGELQIIKKGKKKSHLTHLAFNPRDPIIAVGDERGIVQIYKLSPNLRIMTASSIEHLEIETEKTKLEHTLILEGKVNKKFRKSDVGKKLVEEKKKETQKTQG